MSCHSQSEHTHTHHEMVVDTQPATQREPVPRTQYVYIQYPLALFDTHYTHTCMGKRDVWPMAWRLEAMRGERETLVRGREPVLMSAVTS